MSKHTPGPWKIDPEKGTKVLAESDPRGKIVEVAETYCEFGASPPIGEAWANTLLIAAAPDLLAACRGILDRLDRDGWMDQADEAAIDAVRVALRRAVEEEGGGE